MKSDAFDFKGLKKLGENIAFFRQQKGLTQQDFAKQLGTSQSAVARIEKGEQNLTAESLSKINKVLEKNVVQLANPMLNLRVDGGKKLSGSVTIRPSKNSSVCLLYASLLNKSKTTIKNLTVIEEVLRTLDVLKTLGVETNLKNNNCLVNPANLSSKAKNIDIKANNLLLLIGVLSNYFNKFTIPLNFTATNFTGTLNSHIYSLEQLGFKFKVLNNKLFVDCTKKHGGDVVMYESSDTATLNCVFAAVGISEKVTIKLASSNYQVTDCLNYLKLIGYGIKGISTTTISLSGGSLVSKPVAFNPITDPAESMFYISCGILTNSSINL
jgi:UDP-N-acetylglucosamine 1-carboxyvinyltransferase